MLGALCAHRDAWTRAGVLHRDISVANIMIWEYLDEEGSLLRASRLNDWDICEYAEHMGPGLQSGNAGTWAFRSALSLQYPKKPYHVADDIESFIHVYHQLVLRFYVHNQQADLYDFVRRTYQHMYIRDSDGAQIGGAYKLEQMQRKSPTIVANNFSVLNHVLGSFASICHEHITSISLPILDALYESPKHRVPKPLVVSKSTLRRQQFDDESDDTDRFRRDDPRFLKALGLQSAKSEDATGAPALHPLPDPASWDPYANSPLRDHDALEAILRQAVESTSKKWRNDGRFSHDDDLFKNCTVPYGFCQQPVTQGSSDSSSMESARFRPGSTESQRL
ncbi:hypothetical protein C8Q76DRAFT_714887 [Earliella scabrosa]|nr:hypothetical protein C8Q76DRAFT_714887 [Earliella scabrosa]